MSRKAKNNHYLFVRLVAFCCFISSLGNIRYLKMIFPGFNTVIYASMAVSFVASLVMFVNKDSTNFNRMLLMLCFFGYILFVTLLANNSFMVYIYQVGASICCCLMVFGTTKHDLIIVLHTWSSGLIVLLVIDIVTMILYPYGLYRGQSTYYDINWFLGFKTERLYYLLPLLIMYTYLVFIDGVKKKAKIKLMVIFVSVLGDIIKSNGTSAVIAMIFYTISIIVMFSFSDNGKHWFITLVRRFISRLVNFYVFTSLYFTLFFLIVVTQIGDSLISQIASSTGKSVTLSGRIPIWEHCFSYYENNPIFGFGLQTTEQYQSITQGFNNPHNILLTYLLSSGLVGLIILLVIMYKSFASVKCDRNNLVLVLGVISFFVVGFSSSVLAFCPFFYSCIAITLKKYLDSSV